MNLKEGVAKRRDLNFSMRVDAPHSCCHLFRSAVLLLCLSTDLLCFDGLRSNGGSVFLAEVSPSHAFFASPSTSLFSLIPTWPAVHLTVRKYMAEFLCFLMRVAVSRICSSFYRV